MNLQLAVVLNRYLIIIWVHCVYRNFRGFGDTLRKILWYPSSLRK